MYHIERIAASALDLGFQSSQAARKAKFDS